MIGSLPKPRRNANYGKQPRANPFLRAWRMARRKRVAYARAQVCYTIRHLQRQITRMEATAKAWDVPLDPVGPLPVIPELPGVEWVELRQAMGALREPVRPAPEAAPATS